MLYAVPHDVTTSVTIRCKRFFGMCHMFCSLLVTYIVLYSNIGDLCRSSLSSLSPSLHMYHHAARHLFRGYGPSIVVKLATNVVYSVVVLVLLPNPMHVLWIAYRLATIFIDFLLRDVIAMTENLRLTVGGTSRLFKNALGLLILVYFEGLYCTCTMVYN